MQYRKPILAVMLTSVLCFGGCRSTKESRHERRTETESLATGESQETRHAETGEEILWTDTTRCVDAQGDTTTTIRSGRTETRRQRRERATARRTETAQLETHEREEAEEEKGTRPAAAEPGQAGEPRWKCWVKIFASGFLAACLLAAAAVLNRHRRET